jgi:hypothetical protein
VIWFSVYDLASGEVLRSGSCNEQDINLQIRHIGEAVKEIDEEVATTLRGTKSNFNLNPGDGSVTVRAASLEELKSQKKISLQNVANPKLDLWATPTGGLQVDDISTARLNAWATQALVCKLTSAAFGLPYWIMADNSHHTFADADAFLAFASAAADYKTSAILHHSALKQAIAGAADQAALDAIDLNTGWPT